MKKDQAPHRFESLSEAHRMYGLPKPIHPLISLIDISAITPDLTDTPESRIFNFYKISYKHNLSGKLRYGQGYYDFTEGGLFFVSPNQVTAIGDNNADYSGYTLLIHPDFLQSYPLAKKIRQYGFFSYSANEALHLSDVEKEIVINIFHHISRELQHPIDEFSQEIIISQIEALLNYSNRFYKRQFITRKAVNSGLLLRTEEVLSQYFNREKSSTQGIPTVQFLAEQLHLSPNYFSDMLKHLTGETAQQHIQNKLMEKAKEKLSASDLSISEIAYELGFDYPQSFSRLFKAKTSLSPAEFRESFR